jgi:hypothetical protein
MEQQFVKRFIDDPFDPEIDHAGNRIVTVGDSPRVMFACHTDTVHKVSKRQRVRRRGRYLMATSKHSNCLGADDTGGVWIMVNMIRLGIEGMYIFHYGEEIGCVGATYIAQQTPGLLDNIDISIEFDRRGYTSVVTNQCGQECASLEFAAALCDQLDMEHVPDPTGMFTDNMEYAGLVPEIVNVSVGYFNQHSPQEELDDGYLKELLKAVVEVDYSALPIVREPEEAFTYQWSGGRYHSGYSSVRDEEDAMSYLVENYPDVIVTLLWQHGFDLEDLHMAVYEATGNCDPTMTQDVLVGLNQDNQTGTNS